MAAKQRKPGPVLETKLYPGVGAGSPVARKRLYPSAEFEAGRCPVYLIKAPAGYGKSTLMSNLHEYFDNQGIDCAWLSLDTNDNDPARFMRYLVAAIERVAPEAISKELGTADADFSHSRHALENLAHDLSKLDKRLLIFLDDLQFIDTPEVLEILDWLIGYAPSQCQFILAGRAEPKLQLGKLRVRRRLQEVDYKQLQFTLQETQDLLNARLSLALAEADIERLHERTEGWPAGLELAALALEHEADRADLIESFAGNDQALVDYLGEVVLANLDVDTRRFVYQIAQLDRICDELATHASGLEDASQLLGKLRERNMFLIPLDRHGQWCRFHHLVGEYFRERGHTRHPKLARDALVAGARWLYEHDFAEEAIDLALRAQAWESAAQWIADNAVSINHQKGYLRTNLNWMNALPREWVDRHPVIRSSYAYALAFFSERQGVLEQINLMRERRDQLQTSDPGHAQIGEMDCSIEHLEMLHLSLSDHHIDAQARAEHWLERWPDAAANLRGDVWNILAWAAKSSGEIDIGLRATEQARCCAHEGAETYYYVLVWSHALRALLLMKRGDYRAAREAAREGLQLVQEHTGKNPFLSGMCRSVLGCIAYEFGDREALAEHVDYCLNLPDDFGQADFMILRYLAQARMLFLRGDSENALETLLQGQAVGRNHGLHRVTLSLAAEQCAWLCRLGRIDSAREIAQQHGIAADMQSAPESDPLLADKSYRAGSRIYLREAPEQAAQALSKAIAYCARREFAHRQAELLLAQACAHKHAGNRKEAETSLKQALVLGGRYGYFQMFLDEADALGELLTAIEFDDAQKATRALVQRLQKSLERADESNAVEGLVEKLSKREMQIVQRLDSDLNNREIAAAIFVSEGTLKWHLHNIYGKLAVKNRSGALARARELHYLA